MYLLCAQMMRERILLKSKDRIVAEAEKESKNKLKM